MTPRTLHLWRGTHDAAFKQLFDRAWDDGDLLIACPPTVDRADLETLIESLPAGRVRLAGDWGVDGAELPTRRAGAHALGGVEWPEEPPVLGVFTTGTTRGGSGRKLVLYSRRNIDASQRAIFSLFDAERIDTLFCYPQPYHVFGLLLGYALARLYPVRLIAAPGAYGHAAHELWAAQTSAHMLTLATPSHMHDLAGFLTERALTPRSTYTCILGGAKVERDTWRQARDVARIEAPSIGYGCTEASPGITHLPPGVAPLVDGDIGWPLPHLRLDFGSDGSGYTIRGDGVCLATIEDGIVIFPDRHTVRDELQRLEGGRLAFTHRTDMLLNRGGEKFPLERLEAVLKARLGVDTICVALPDPRLGAELGVVARAEPAAADAIFATLAEVFKRRFNPQHLRLVQSLPLNPSAKPDRQRATTMFSEA